MRYVNVLKLPRPEEKAHEYLPAHLVLPMLVARAIVTRRAALVDGCRLYGELPGYGFGVKGGAGYGPCWYLECGLPASYARTTARPSVRTTSRAGKSQISQPRASYTCTIQVFTPLYGVTGRRKLLFHRSCNRMGWNVDFASVIPQ